MWLETCVEGYQKCVMRHVHRVIRNVTWDVYRVIRNETCVQGYQKCDMGHVYRVIRNETWDMCTGLSEMWNGTCVQGYQKWDMRHVYRVIRNVTWDMCTGLSDMWHGTCVNSVQLKSSGLKFSRSRRGSHVTYSCHHNLSLFSFPILVHSWRFSVFHSFQSITPRIY